MLKDFSFWEEYEGASEGSGRSEKIWLVNPVNGVIGLFKFPKTEYTTEHLSEKIAADIASLINIECMDVDLGVYDSRVGSLSYRINSDNEDLIEGIRLISKYYPYFSEEILYDSERDEYYSLEMILNSLKEFGFRKDFLSIPIFDFLIGNTDRHQSNWAILKKDKDFKLCPIYDNGSSLCCYIEEPKIDCYLGNDKRRFKSLVDTKSRSRIRVDKKSKKEPTHLQVLEFLRVNYYSDVIDLVLTIQNKINGNSIDNILNKYSDILSDKRTILIKRYIRKGKVNVKPVWFVKGGENVSEKAGKDYIFLIWKAPKTRKNYIVGQLSKNGQYEFSYGYEVKEAIKEGFELLIPFDDIDKIYKNDTLFPTFSSRLPDKKRRGIEKILFKYNLQEYDEYKLLKRSGARLPIDNLEFIDPILEIDGKEERTFFIAGLRYYMVCQGEDCNEALDLKIKDKLTLELNPENEYDKYAIKVVDLNGNHVGYLPRYYSESMTDLLKHGAKYDCTVLEVNKEHECRECIKVRLEINTDVEGIKKIS